MHNNLSIFFSIIVPVYNVQDYLTACVESVLQQDFTDFELILVDDGSTDRSGILCDELALKDPRIRVMHQKNGGASSARNNGLRHARGEYVLFLDSDDFYPQHDFLKEVYKKSENKDVVCFNYARYTNKLLTPLVDFPDECDMEADQLLLALVKRNAFTSSPCLKAVKRKLLTENNIQFEEGTSGEDIEWNAKVMCKAHSYALVPQCLYAYRVREGSVTQSISEKHVRMLLRIINKLIETPIQGSQDFCDAYNSYVAFQYCTLLINARLCKPGLDRETLHKIRDMAWLLKYDANRLVKLIHTVYNLLGFEITSWLLLIYFKLFCK